MDEETLAEELKKLETWQLLWLLEKELERRQKEDLLPYWDTAQRLGFGDDTGFKAVAVLKILE